MSVTLSLAVFLIFAACKRAENRPVQPAQTEAQTQMETMKKEEPKPAPRLDKWPADYPVTGDSVAVITVSQAGVGELGQIVVEFLPDKAPNHVRNFKWLTDHGFYNGLKFHRVMKGFMIQGGCPLGTGTGGPGWNVDAEFNDTSHKRGVLSMARSKSPNSAGSQFFICHADAPGLDNDYTVFGRVIKGMEIVDKVANVTVVPPPAPPDASTPKQAVVMSSVKIVPRSAIPK